MKRFIWNVSYMLRAMWVLRESPWFAWDMARQEEDSFNEGDSPREALYTELSYWGIDQGGER